MKLSNNIFQVALDDYYSKKKSLQDLQKFIATNYQEIQFFLDADLDQFSLENGLVEELKALIRILRIIYTDSGYDTLVEDSQYDILFDKLERLEDMEEDFTDPIATVKPKGYHLYPSLRGTLDKIYYLSDKEKDPKSNRRSLDDWIATSEAVINQFSDDPISLRNAKVYVFPKWDGVSVILEYDENGELQRALTRGYTRLNEAVLVTPIFQKIAPTIKHPYDTKRPFGIKTEIMTSTKDLLTYNATTKPPYKNTRAFASGILNSETQEDLTDNLVIIPLRTSSLDENGEEGIQQLHPDVFKFPYLYCKLSEIDKIEEFAQEHHEVHGLRCDGVVIYLEDPLLQQLLGRKNDKQKFEVAYKFTEEYSYAVIRGVKYSVGLYGTITPELIIEPIKMKGNTITHISLGSIGKLHQLNPGKGDVIRVGYDIIPVIASPDSNCHQMTSPRFHCPERCPVCWERLEIDKVTAKCVNKNCPSKKMGKIKNHILKLRISSIGDALLEQMFINGIVEDIEDLYKLKKHKKELLELGNFGKKKLKRILQEMEDVTSRRIDSATLCAALSIERLSIKTYEKIFDEITLDELLEAVDNEEKKVLLKIHGIGKSTVDILFDAFSKKKTRKLLEFLRETLTVEESPKEHPFCRIVFTSFGQHDERKKKVREILKLHHGIEDENISLKTDYLIVPDRAVNSRAVKYAKEHQIPIFTADEFIQRVIPKD